MNFDKLAWIWLYKTSTAVLTDVNLKGDQAHVGFGNSADELDEFTQGTQAQVGPREWRLPLQEYGDMRAYDLKIVQNAPERERSDECRITAQRPSSTNPYPLWQRVVDPIPSGSRPQQIILFLRDENDEYHARVLGEKDFYRLPKEINDRLLAGRTSGLHVYERSGTFDDIPCPPPRSQPDAERWSRLQKYMDKLEKSADTPRETRTVTREEYVRRPDVRQAALDCFGKRCQVQGCQFTEVLPDDLVEYVLEVHHLEGVAEGGSDSPFNLAVLCANHHRLCEGLPGAKIVEDEETDSVTLEHDGGSFLIERDLAPLRERME